MKVITILVFVLLGTTYIAAQSTEGDQKTSGSQTDEGQKLSAEVVRLFTAGKYEEALPLAKRVVTLREKSHGSGHMLLAQASRNLAFVELKLGHGKEAGAAFDTAASIFEKNQPLSKSDESALAEMLETVAYFDIQDAAASKAIPKLKRAITLREKINGVDALETAGSVGTLGRLYHILGEYEKATPLLIRALEIQAKTSSTAGIDNLILRETAYCALTKTGKRDEADTVYRKFRSSTNGTPDIPKDKTVSGGVLNGKATSLPKPPYPAEAKASRAAGAVAIKVLIDEAGCPLGNQDTIENLAGQKLF